MPPVRKKLSPFPNCCLTASVRIILSMKLTAAEVAGRLAAAPDHDVCVLRIEDGDYGCEEPKDPPLLWLLVQRADGEKLCREIPEPVVDALGLTEGCTCRLEDLCT